MDKANSKIITLSFAIFSALSAFTLHLLIKIFAGVFGIVARYSDLDGVRHGVPIVFGIGIFLYLQFTPKVLSWADEVIGEIRKVVWPSRKDTTAMTIVCIVMVLISSLIISSFDFISGLVINSVMR